MTIRRTLLAPQHKVEGKEQVSFGPAQQWHFDSDGNILHQTKLLKGEMPATPVSYAGVARRSYRRAAIYH